MNKDKWQKRKFLSDKGSMHRYDYMKHYSKFMEKQEFSIASKKGIDEYGLGEPHRGCTVESFMWNVQILYCLHSVDIGGHSGL